MNQGRPGAMTQPNSSARGFSYEKQKGLLNLLRESSEKVARFERHLSAERRRRDLLMLNLAKEGLTTREIAMFAGVSPPAVSYAVRRAKAVTNA